MTTVFPGARYLTKGTALTGTSATACYTCGAGVYADGVALNIAPAGGVGGNVTITWYDASSATSFTQVEEIVLATNANSSWNLALHFEPGDELRVAGESGMHVTITVLEAGRNAGVR